MEMSLYERAILQDSIRHLKRTYQPLKAPTGVLPPISVLSPTYCRAIPDPSKTVPSTPGSLTWDNNAPAISSQALFRPCKRDGGSLLLLLDG